MKKYDEKILTLNYDKVITMCITLLCACLLACIGTLLWAPSTAFAVAVIATVVLVMIPTNYVGMRRIHLDKVEQKKMEMKMEKGE